MKGLVDDAYGIVTSQTPDFNSFGKLLNETWKLKRGAYRFTVTVVVTRSPW